MLLENMTFVEVEEYLEDNDTLLLPVGSTEQHSEYGLIGTDFIAAEGVAREVGGKCGIVVAPTVNYGVSPHHMQFAGTATLSPSTLQKMLIDLCLSFVHHGFRRIFVVNGHGGNKSTIETAFQELKMRGCAGQFALFSWYEGLKETEMIKELFNNQDGSHATPSEISLTMLLRPESFAGKQRDAKVVEEAEYYWPLSAEEMRQVFPDGRMGAASWLATVEKGRLVMAVAAETLTEKIEKMQAIPLLDE